MANKSWGFTTRHGFWLDDEKGYVIGWVNPGDRVRIFPKSRSTKGHKRSRKQ
jgi:hypothetical protein